MNVVIIDNNIDNLDKAKKTIDGKVETLKMDVSKIEEFEELKNLVGKSYGGKIDFLALNAGIGLRGTWSDPEYFQKIMAVNLFGVINGISALLPLVSKDSPASIVITGSKQGITNPPGNPAYNASKAAVKTLAEHLSFDLSKSHPNASVHLLVPGWTFTAMTGSTVAGYARPAGAWSPEQVVEYLETRMAEEKFYVICPDNDVSEETDKKRFLWAANDIVQGRPPLTRWRDEYKSEAEDWMAKLQL